MPSFLTKHKEKVEQATEAKKPTAAPVGILKTGAAAKQALEVENAKAEAAASSAGRMFRFWLKPDEEKMITFIDGNLDEQGMLDIPYAYEHQFKLDGKPRNYVCIENEEPCPMCAADIHKPFVGYLTVIDHTPWKDKEGKTHEHTLRLLVAKRNSLKMLLEYAEKRGGLAGCTFEVSRSGPKAAAIGDIFEFQEKNSLQELATATNLTIEPTDYNAQVEYKTGEQLVALGIGKKVATIGSHTSGIGSKAIPDDDDESPF